jgi:hypothetical protein
MIKNIKTVLIWSEDYKKLAKWYKDKLNLKQVEEITHPDDTGILFQVGEVGLWIGQHSKVKGKNKDLHRHMINLVVDSVEIEYKRLNAKGIKFYSKPFKAPTFDKYFATFYDLDDNLVQLYGDK